MIFDPDAAYQVLLARDSRFDGRLFVGVTSTGVYCRPICRVRTPMQRNCRFFDTQAQAEAASFRPCLKCRPEIAPGPGLPWTVMDASGTLARQAADALDAGAAAGETPSIADLAARLGVSERHVRRIFFTSHGVTPLQYLQTRRLLLAKQLLTDTALPVAQVALSSGFKSLRRFNAAFAENYRMQPGQLRRASKDRTALARDESRMTVTLGYRTPYDHAHLLRFFERRAIPHIDVVDGLSIRRSVRAGTLADAGGWIEATFVPGRSHVRLAFAPTLSAASGRVVAAARRWLDLDASPDTIADALVDLPGPAGMRLPGSLDAFELAVRAVLGQQVTVAAARTLARRLVSRFGAPIATPWSDVDRTFPSPTTLAACELSEIAELGIIRSRASALIDLASHWDGDIEPLLGVRADPATLVTRLCECKGIGPWTAHYIAMRALGWPDAFPPGDVAVLKAMRDHFGIDSHRAVERHLERWRPWRAYALLRLWNLLEKAA